MYTSIQWLLPLDEDSCVINLSCTVLLVFLLVHNYTKKCVKFRQGLKVQLFFLEIVNM